MITFVANTDNMEKVTENPLKNREGSDMLPVVVAALFVTAYLVSNIMAYAMISKIKKKAI